jgi:hypothetical protein
MRIQQLRRGGHIFEPKLELAVADLFRNLAHFTCVDAVTDAARDARRLLAHVQARDTQVALLRDALLHIELDDPEGACFHAHAAPVACLAVDEHDSIRTARNRLLRTRLHAFRFMAMHTMRDRVAELEFTFDHARLVPMNGHPLGSHGEIMFLFARHRTGQTAAAGGEINSESIFPDHQNASSTG